MAKGQHLSQYQQKIVRSYYEHGDTIALGKLGESAGELFLCTDAKKAGKLWETVERALAKLAPADARAKKVVETRDVKGLGQLVSDLSARK